MIAGERRWRAAQAAGLLKIPVMIKEVDDDRLLELALIENVQREQLNPIEEANAYQTLINDLGLTQQQVAERVGKQRTTVTNFLRLLNLEPEVQRQVAEGLLSAGHAKALAGVTNKELQIDLAERTVHEGLTVRQLEALASRKGGRSTGQAARKEPERDPNIVSAEERLQSAMGTKVRIVQAKGGRGRLELHFFSAEELERIYELVLKATRTDA